jgi:hypothetical protein
MKELAGSELEMSGSESEERAADDSEVRITGSLYNKTHRHEGAILDDEVKQVDNGISSPVSCVV